jgi:hypothetical protein
LNPDEKKTYYPFIINIINNIQFFPGNNYSPIHETGGEGSRV